ncbi:hypothetical protein BH20ACT13_BH20ACT13_23350 [soil metagenome]
MRIGLAAAVVAMVVSPTALAVAEKPKPKPDALWEAFPLEPTPERPASTPVPPVREPPASPFLPPSPGSEATTIADAPSEASGPGSIVLAFAVLLLLVATVSVLSGRRLYVSKRRRRTTVLWQGAALPTSSDYDRQLQGSGVRTSSAPVGRELRAGEPHPDVLAPRYRWADKAPVGRSRPSIGSEISTLTHRFRKTVWTEDTAPAIIGSALAVVMGWLLVYLIG